MTSTSKHPALRTPRLDEANGKKWVSLTEEWIWKEDYTSIEGQSPESGCALFLAEK